MVIKGLAVWLRIESIHGCDIAAPIDLAKLRNSKGNSAIPHFGLEADPRRNSHRKGRRTRTPTGQTARKQTAETVKRAEKKPPTLIRGEKTPTE